MNASNATISPDGGPIAALRAAPRLLRAVAALVAIAFAMLVLAPSVAAARERLSGEGQTVAVVSDERDLARTLERIDLRLGRLAERLERRLDAAADAQDLGRLRQRLERLGRRVERGFERIEERLRAQALPEVILERQRATVAAFRAELAAMLAKLDAVADPADTRTRAEKAKEARVHLQGKRLGRSRQPFDPHNLPTRALQPNPANRPKTDAEGFRKNGFFDTPLPRFAAAGGLYRLDGLPGADDPAYLAESDEAVLTEAIRAKSAELGEDPVRIYYWVRNRIEWQPGWGAAQDAELTLQARRGNAMDIAGLLIALLRSAGFPARYVHGTIEVPEDRFRNWAGGFEDISSAADYAASGGIPLATVSAGGRIAAVRMEHVWVEAAVDFHPSRGARNRAADLWLPLDPSFKQYEYRPGLDALTIGGIDPEQLAASFVASGTVDETGGWVAGLDPAMIESAQQQARSRLEHYIADNLAAPTVGDLIGGRRVLARERPVLPSATANRIVIVGARYDRLPARLQQRIEWSFGRYATPVSFPWARINNRKVTLSFEPATEADEQVLQSLLPAGEITDFGQLPASIPAYLVAVVPRLKLEGETVLTGSPLTLGAELDLVTQVHYPARHVPAHTYKAAAGSFLVVNSVAGNVSAARLEAVHARLQATKSVLEGQDPEQVANLTREDLLGDIFHAGSLGYFAQLLGLAHSAGLQAAGRFRLQAGLGTIGYEPHVETFFGIPRAIEPGGVALDIPLHLVSAVDGSDPDRRRQFNLQLGSLSSTLEHAVPEQLFGTAEQPAEAISAAKALARANAPGQRI